MWIYLLIGLLFLILALEGYFKGGINGAITLLGVVLAINFSDSFGGLAFSWFTDGKWPIDVNPFWHRAMPTLFGFIALVLIFAIAGIVVSMIVRKRLSDRWDEFQLNNFKRMNRKLGLCTGLVTALIYSVMMLSIIYRLGNFTVPLKQDSGDKGLLAKLNEARVQLDDTPFLGIAAAYDKTPELHYEVRNLLMLIWDDRGKKLQDLLTAYPGFYALAEESEIKSLIGSEDESDSSSEDSYSDDSYASSDEESGSGESLYEMWKSGDSLTLEQILSNSDVVAAINNRYEELKAIEPGSKEAKKLLKFMGDIEKFFETGQSNLYGRDRIVGRWKFARNASLRATKENYVDVSSVEEMRAIGGRMSQMEGVWAKVWPESDGNVIRFYGYSKSAMYAEVLKDVKEVYQKALDEGEIEEDDNLGDYNFSRPAEYGQTYGQEEGEEGENNQVDIEATKKMIQWVSTNKPGYIPLMFAAAREDQNRGANSRAQLISSKGDWSGSGSLYRLNVNGVQEKLSKELMLFVGTAGRGIALRGKNVKANLVEAAERNTSSKDEKERTERLQIRLGKDVLVFTRF
ncbi:MAG: CvpA family protein [Verrucomicrobiota bacterium]|nr:CvpA family protein [Verrucomicrobiota bacterium]